ncbi:hypothetical protein [uncultured Bacteroides sp.]|uniref:hypothetical protein n=1 Tax=uncultured Bacteroides sp. TaxID=162156 RepID=UPI002619D4E6|nr:hypothetical protein [uncultured Bacteroides sp.]
MTPLTDEQRQFAADNHALIYSFLNEEGLDEREYYDIAALGYVSAVRRYLMRSELRRYAFSTVAWKSMRRSITAFYKAESRRVKAEQSYLESSALEDPMEEMEARLILHDLASVAHRAQYELAILRLQGYSIADVAKKQGISPKKVRSLLKNLYRECFQKYTKKEAKI